MDDDRNEIINKSIYCEDGKIVDIGDLANFHYNPEFVIDAFEKVVIPGLVNTHHHLFQNFEKLIEILENFYLQLMLNQKPKYY